MQFKNLTDKNIVIYMMKTYQNPICNSVREFESDIKRFTYMKKLIYGYSTEKKEINLKLITNHIIILSNVFSISVLLRLLFFHYSKENYNILISFLQFLNIISGNEIIYGIRGENIILSKIAPDFFILGELRKTII